MAAKKAPAKKAASKQPAKPLWCWCEKGDEEYGETFLSRESAIKAAKEYIHDRYSASWDKPKKPPTIMIFQQVEELQFNVIVEEIPVTSFTTKVTVV